MIEPPRTVTINSRKFNGDIHRAWKAELLEKRGSLLVFKGVFENEVRHSKLGVIGRGTISYEYYWLDRWYNVFRFHEPDGALRNFYCNINLPPSFENEVLDYIDLEIDVLVAKDFETEILDLDEFEENSKFYGYPKEIIAGTFLALDELLKIIERRRFPFA